MIQKGTKVKVEYTGTLKDGSVFDSSEGKEPLEFEAGEGKVIKGFDAAVLGMKLNEEKTFTIPAADAYGEPRPEMVNKIPKEQVPDVDKLKEGMLVGVALPTGQHMPAQVKAIDDKEVTLDLNHPLAGKDLTFKIKIVGMETA